MKDLKTEVDEHNKRAIEEQKQLAIRKREAEAHLKPYIKGLSDDVNVLTAECVVLNRAGNLADWELGRRLMYIQSLVTGHWRDWLKQAGITRYKAERLIKEVREIRDVHLKFITQKPLEIDALPDVSDGEIIEGDDLGKKLESGEATPQDFARRSPTDVKKLIQQVQKLQGELRKLEEEKAILQVQVDLIKLGTIDEQKIREWLTRWQMEWIGGRNRVLGLLRECSEAAQMDVFASLQWFGRELMQLEMECSARWPDFSIMSEADQAALGVWLERRRPVSPIERVSPESGVRSPEEEKTSSTEDAEPEGMRNYRKAKVGEIICADCEHSQVRKESGRLECALTTPRSCGGFNIVGRNHTCDTAEWRGGKK